MKSQMSENLHVPFLGSLTEWEIANSDSSIHYSDTFSAEWGIVGVLYECAGRLPLLNSS